MKVTHDNLSVVLRRCNEAHHDDHHDELRTDSVSSVPSAESTDVSSMGEWEHDRQSKKQARAAGRAMLKRMKQFESSSSLPEDGSRRVVELSWKDLEIGEVIGAGGFSSVYLVSICPEQEETHRDAGDCETTPSSSRTTLCYRNFALKFLDKKVWERGTDSMSQAAADLAFEAKMLSRLDHENIIQIHGTAGGSPSAFFEDKRGFFLILDLLEETLSDRLVRWKADGHNMLLNRLEIAAVGIARGMEYLHKKNIVFRDIKPQNIGFCKATGDVKIFDFGLAAEIETGERLNSAVGTPRYMAPEVMMRETYDSSCDVYSFGIMLWQICSLRKPFSKKFTSREELFDYVAVHHRRPSFKSLSCPASIKNLIKECWHPDPQRRPTFKTIRRRLERAISSEQ